MAFTMRTPPTGGDWTERSTSLVSSWGQRTPDWYYGPWITEYLIWDVGSFPWLLDSGDPDWRARMDITWLLATATEPLLTEDDIIITL